MKISEIEVGKWYHHAQHGTVYAADMNPEANRVFITDAANKNDVSSDAWVPVSELSELEPGPVVRTPPEPPNVPDQQKRKDVVNARPARRRAHNSCTFEVTFPLPPSATLTDAKQYVLDAVTSHKGGYLPGDAMQDLDGTKVRVKLVRKTTFY